MRRLRLITTPGSNESGAGALRWDDRPVRGSAPAAVWGGTPLQQVGKAALGEKLEPEGCGGTGGHLGATLPHRAIPDVYGSGLGHVLIAGSIALPSPAVLQSTGAMNTPVLSLPLQQQPLLHPPPPITNQSLGAVPTPTGCCQQCQKISLLKSQAINIARSPSWEPGVSGGTGDNGSTWESVVLNSKGPVPAFWGLPPRSVPLPETPALLLPPHT